MLRALVADAALLNVLNVVILRQISQPPYEFPDNTVVIPLDENNAIEAVDKCIQDADAVWPLLPETGGLLETTSERVLFHRKVLLGSSPEAVHLTASKFRTAELLLKAGILAVPTYYIDSSPRNELGAWVVKPDDGAGCSRTNIISHLNEVQALAAPQFNDNYVLQPYIRGRACSLTLFCTAKEIFLLGCNDHRVAMSNNRFYYMGSTVNSIVDNDGELGRLASQVVSVFPGLWGYVGIDFIMTPGGPVVLEVNPRMTLAHVGLRASIGVNPVKLPINTLFGFPCEKPNLYKSRQVSVDISAARQYIL
jgi:tyramine---L-glutamate ligase